MEALYQELWGKFETSNVIQDFTIQVPKPTNFNRYGIDPLRATSNTQPRFSYVLPRQKSKFTSLRTKARLPSRGTRILVRKEYRVIEKLLEDEEEEKWSELDQNEDPEMGACLDYKVLGQPGCGKSFFLSYLLVRRLLRSQPTVYRRGDDCCYIFQEDTAGIMVDARHLFGLPGDQKRKLWILTDETLDNPQWQDGTHEWFVILAASPKKVRDSKQWAKDRNIGVRYMSNWGWEEIFAAFSMQYPDPSPEQIERLYTTFTCLGPVPRTCLEIIPTKNNTSYHDKLVKYLREVDQACRSFIRSSPCPAIDDLLDEDSGHQIAIMEPESKGSAFHTRIITRWIAHKIAEKGEKRQQLNGYLLYKSLCIQPLLRTAAGWFFERYAHDWLRRGGKFQAQKLLQNQDIPAGDIILTFQAVASHEDRINYFTTTGNLSEQVTITGGAAISSRVVGRYYLPYSPTQESFDGLLFRDVNTLILFQFTIAARHEVKAHGIKDLLGALPNTIRTILLVFVIPEHRNGNYVRPRAVPAPRAVGRRADNLSIMQYKLVFRDRDMESVAVNTRITTAQEVGTGSSHGLGEGDDDSQQTEHTGPEDDSDNEALGPSGRDNVSGGGGPSSAGDPSGGGSLSSKGDPGSRGGPSGWRY